MDAIDSFLTGQAGLFDELLAYQQTSEFQAEAEAHKMREQERFAPVRKQALRRYRERHPEFGRMRYEAQKHKPYLYSQQHGLCVYCNRPLGRTYTIDHLVPLIRGGTNQLSNLRVCHARCNQKKAARTFAQLPLPLFSRQAA